MAWSKNNRACKTTWTTLVALDQMSPTVLFKNAGKKKMKSLLFFAESGTKAALKTRANGLAFDMDRVFQVIRGAKFEEGITHVKAINAMVKVLIDENKTVADLAATADDQYKFHGEGT